MHLRRVFVRFYKSFNFDYLRKYNPKIQKRYEWEKLDDLWYPFVEIPIDEKITTVVGANESGKTHLLTAIEKGLSGEEISRGDFCRYSQFFAVEQGKMRWPDFGFEWQGVTKEEGDAVAAACGSDVTGSFDHFLMFRHGKQKLLVYLPTSLGYAAHEVAKPSELTRVLPRVFRLQENVALPESVPIRFLAGEGRASRLAALSRQQRAGMLDGILGHPDWFQSKETVAQSAEPISKELRKFFSSDESNDESTEMAARKAAEQDLARDLIREVAEVDPDALKELNKALREGRDAFAHSIVDQINQALEAKLNFPHWWVQDREFRLLVAPREYDLVFTIRDRTDTEYAFTERSSGLRYFLSYYIQYLAHESVPGVREILLMDEPDAFLSHQGQQDLLKIFDAFANPAEKKPAVQVVYVTHSPFLIDKNHGERIRVLEKGGSDEGTRVVGDASRNHYEPLRSAFGAFVAETTFMGHCNLIVEGPSDQVLLAAAAAHLRTRGAPDVETIDLNHITIVPASGASHVPYLVYLARGRDIEKPAIVVLLDGDDAGRQARKGILRGGPNRKELLNAEYILELGDLSKASGIRAPGGHALVESEDLLPIAISVDATRRYLLNVAGAEATVADRVTVEAIGAELREGQGVFASIGACLVKISDELHIEKIGFARSVVEILAELAGREKSNDQSAGATLAEFDKNMRALFRELRQMQRRAERELASERVSARVARAKSSFLQDHPHGAKREEVFVLLEEIDSSLDNSAEADDIRRELQGIRRDFKIDEDLTAPVDEFATFRERLDQLRYAARLATQMPTLQEVAATGGGASV